jgi:riboflavin biosynthesis pyrimidine reductase
MAVSGERFRRLLPGDGIEATAAELVAELDLAALAPADRPAVVLNMIASLDGRVTVEGRTGPLANRADFEMFHALRGAADAVLVGAGTVRAEGYGPMEQLAVVASASLDLSPELGLLRAPGNRVVIVTPSEGELPGSCAAEVTYVRAADLGTALKRLRSEHGVRSVVCEGGPHLNAALLPAGLIDELHLVLSPMVVGGARSLTLLESPPIDPPLAGRLVWLLESGGYVFARYRLDPR